MNLIDLIHQKLELFRLEQRYTRRRNRRSTFVSEAQYVDGDYIYAQNTSYSTKCSSGSSDSEETVEASSPTTKESKASRRLSKIASDWRGKASGGNPRQSRVSVREVRWE